MSETLNAKVGEWMLIQRMGPRGFMLSFFRVQKVDEKGRIYNAPNGDWRRAWKPDGMPEVSNGSGIVCRPTEAELNAHIAEIAQREKAQAERHAYESRQDVQDAALIESCLNHDREKAIAAIGAELLRQIARKLEESQ